MSVPLAPVDVFCCPVCRTPLRGLTRDYYPMCIGWGAAQDEQGDGQRVWWAHSSIHGLLPCRVVPRGHGSCAALVPPERSARVCAQGLRERRHLSQFHESERMYV